MDIPIHGCLNVKSFRRIMFVTFNRQKHGKPGDGYSYWGEKRSGKKGLIPVFLLIQSLKLSKCVQIKISAFYFFQLKDVLLTFLQFVCFLNCDGN